MNKTSLLIITLLLPLNAIADYKVYSNQNNLLPIPKERPLFEQKISFENDENHSNVRTSGKFTSLSEISIAGRNLMPTDGNLLGAAYKPSDKFGSFYGYVYFKVPEHVKFFKLNFNYVGMGGSSSGTPTSEFRLQSKHNENSSFSTFKILNIFSSDWITFNENYISNNKFQ